MRAGYPVCAKTTYPEVDIPLIASKALAAREDESAAVIDIRPGEHYRKGHIEGSINIDLEVLHDTLGQIPTDRPIVLVDHKGKLTLTTGRFLHSKRFTDIKRLDGGFNAWIKCGLPSAQSAPSVGNWQPRSGK